MPTLPHYAYLPAPHTIVCETTQKFLNVMAVADRLNQENNDFPVKVVQVSGPISLIEEGTRYVDVYCTAFGKLEHFKDAVSRLDHQSQKFVSQMIRAQMYTYIDIDGHDAAPVEYEVDVEAFYRG